MKRCTRCNVEKRLEDFGADRRRTDNRESACRSCENRRKVAARARECPEKRRARKNAWRAKNADRERERMRRWQGANREKARSASRAWKEANRERLREYDRARRATPEGRAKSSADGRRWRQNNPEKNREYVAERKAAKSARTPVWADLAAIREFYRSAGDQAVDHVIPLRGKRVSGLHVLANLQLLSGSENSAKCNGFVPRWEILREDLLT